MRITKAFIDKLDIPKPSPEGKPTQAFYRDSAVPGFGLRVTSGGAKAFIAEKRIHGKVKRITLGRYGNLTVEQARSEAAQLLGQVAAGKDPISDRKARAVKGATLLQAFEDYLGTRMNLKTSTVHDYRRSLNGPLADWRATPLAEISRDMVELRHRTLGKTSHARANNAMRLLRAIFNHARKKYQDAQGNPIIAVNPVDRLNDTRAWYTLKRRRSLIKPHQLPDWYAATLRLNQTTTRDYLHFLLFTGLRRSEASRLPWADVDFGNRTFTVRDNGDRRRRTLPLSEYLYQLLKRRFETRTSPYVFPSDSERGYLVEPRTAVARVAELSGVRFTLYDLRRTFITIAESLDIPGYALKHLINHKDPNDVTAGHVVSGVDRLRAPMQRISDVLARAMRTAKTTPAGELKQ